jgi:ADP-ribosylglycohydrolase
MAIGDAYGAGFEYRGNKYVAEHNDLSRYHPHGLGDLEPGCYTDDTQMSIALSELMLSNEAWTIDNIAKRFFTTYDRDPRKGYSKRIQSQLDYGSVDGLLFGMKGGGNGGAMRAGVLGLYPELLVTRTYALLQATITHDTRAAVSSAAAAAVAVHYLVHGEATRWNVGMLTQMDVGGDFECPWPETWRVGSHPSQAVRAAFTAIQKGNTLSEVLRTAIAFGGDTDTVATIAMALATWCPDIEKDLPQHLYDGLENGNYGLDYLRDLDQQLLDRFTG